MGIDPNIKLKIFYILLNLGVDSIVVWLSIVFINKIYFKRRQENQRDKNGA